jgi:predicted dehydrogenase
MDLKAAVIGCGRMGAKKSDRLEGIVPSGWLPISHSENFYDLNNVELVALSDNDEHTLKEAGNEYNVKSMYHNYADMLKECKLDLISIATRTPEKASIIKEAISSGVKGIYVEKPLANNLAITSELLSLAEKNDCKFSYGVNRRFHSTYRKAKSLLESGAIGRLKEVNIGFGESPLLWTHPHSMDLLVFYAGKPVRARADLREDSVNKVDDYLVDSDPIILSAQFEFENEVRGSISVSNGCVVNLYGDKGTLTIHGDGAFIQLSTASELNSPYFHNQNFIHPQPKKGATNVAFDELRQAITGNLTKQDFLKTISPEDIFFSQSLLFACVWSHLNSNQYVYIKNVPQQLFVTGKTGQFYA